MPPGMSQVAAVRRMPDGDLGSDHVDAWAAPEDHAIGGWSAGSGARWW
jgi:hypothetical protein